MTIATFHKASISPDSTSLNHALSLSTHAKPKYHLRAGLLYLHQEGKHLQSGRNYAWVGTIEQARAMRRTSDAAAGCKARPVTALPVHTEMEV